MSLRFRPLPSADSLQRCHVELGHNAQIEFKTFEHIALAVNRPSDSFIVLEIWKSKQRAKADAHDAKLDALVGLPCLDDDTHLVSIHPKTLELLDRGLLGPKTGEILRLSEWKHARRQLRIQASFVPDSEWKGNANIDKLDGYLQNKVLPRQLFDKSHLSLSNDGWLLSMLARKLALRTLTVGAILPIELLEKCIAIRIDSIIDKETNEQMSAWFSDGELHISICFDEALHELNLAPRVDSQKSDIQLDRTDVNVARGIHSVSSSEMIAALVRDGLAGIQAPATKILTLLHSVYDSSNAGIPDAFLPRGIIVHGREGSGKTSLCRSLGQFLERECGIRLVELSGLNALVKAETGKSEELYNWVKNEILSRQERNVLVLIDEFDLLARRSESLRDVQLALHVFLRYLLESTEPSICHKRIAILACAPNIDSLDASFSMPGRFSQEVQIPMPGAQDRLDMLRIMLAKVPEWTEFTKSDACSDLIDQVVSLTPGFVANDLHKVCRATLFHASAQDPESRSLPPPSKANFDYALRVVKPAQLSSFGAGTVPSVSWDQIGGYQEQKRRCMETMLWPLEHPESFKKLDLPSASGLLLHGPSGCGKSLLVKGLASLGKMKYFAIKCPELFSKYTGETEELIRDIFKQARQLEPCVLVFDEIDSIAPRRDDDSQSVTDSGSARRALSQLLNEIDGIQSRRGVFLVGCTNRKDAIDQALLRPGRLDQHILMDVPTNSDRLEILKVITSKMPLGSEVGLDALAAQTEGFTGADLYGLCRESAIESLRENIQSSTISMLHFTKILQTMKLQRGFDSGTADSPPNE